MKVYSQGEEVAHLTGYDALKLGGEAPAFIYEGQKLVHPAPVMDGLVLWYDFKGRADTDPGRETARDLSGQDNHGTLLNFDFGDGSNRYMDGGLAFDGVDDYIDVMATPETPRGLYTMEGVFSSNYTHFGGVVGNFRHLSERYGMSIAVNASNNILFYWADETGAQRSGAYTGAEVGRIYHAVIIYVDGAIQGFVNGERVVNIVTEYRATSANTAGALNVGKWAPSYFDYRLDGTIYSVRSYSAPLSPEQIRHNYDMERARFGIQ